MDQCKKAIVQKNKLIVCVYTHTHIYIHIHTHMVFNGENIILPPLFIYSSNSINLIVEFKDPN